VHRHHLRLWQHIIQVGEHGFFHLTGIFRAADQHDLAGEIAGDDRFGAATVAGGIGLEGGEIDNGHLRNKACQLLQRGADQQVADEQRVPGHLRIDAGADPVGGIGAAVKVLREQGLASGMGEKISQQNVELGRRERAIVVPPDAALRHGVLDDELVLGRTAREDAGIDAQGAALHQHAFAPGKRFLIKNGGLKVPANRLQFAETEGRCVMRRIENADVLHG
jgi:hypothetical protein